MTLIDDFTADQDGEVPEEHINAAIHHFRSVIGKVFRSVPDDERVAVAVIITSLQLVTARFMVDISNSLPPGASREAMLADGLKMWASNMEDMVADYVAEDKEKKLNG